MRHLNPTLLIAEADRLERAAQRTMNPLDKALLWRRAVVLRDTAHEVNLLQRGELY